jgi:hypothetical protein
MTPRAPASGTGLRGPGQEIFPEEAKQQALDIGLEEDAAQILKSESVPDGGGDTTTTWVPDGEPVDARIDAIGRMGGSKVFAEQIDETTTHVITMEPGATVAADSRIEIEGRTWVVTGQNIRTDEPTTQVQVREK